MEEVMYNRCAGIDVHKKALKVCVRVRNALGKLEKEVRSFGTMTRDLRALRDWFTERGVTHVAMESTGVYWKPIYNILEGSFEIILVNAKHIKTVPGRKTDVKDCEWLAQMMQYGLLKGSFIPPVQIRDLRDLTRQRSQLISERTRVVNRIHKTLEDANIKLGAVATDILGVSGRQMLQGLIEGLEDPEKLAEMARRRMRAKIPELTQASEGEVREHHRFMLRTLWDHLVHLEKLIAELDTRIKEKTSPFEQALQLLDQIPGIDRRLAEVIIAEIGRDMSQFPSSAHLCSWAGMSPGNNESAGKHKSGKTTKGSRWLRQGLVQGAWAATRTKNTYLSAQYKRLARRRGKKRALIAVAHSMLGSIFYILQDNLDYKDLGGDYFERLDPERLKKYFVKRLEQLGHTVELKPTDEDKKAA